MQEKSVRLVGRICFAVSLQKVPCHKALINEMEIHESSETAM